MPLLRDSGSSTGSLTDSDSSSSNPWDPNSGLTAELIFAPPAGQAPAALPAIGESDELDDEVVVVNTLCREVQETGIDKRKKKRRRRKKKKVKQASGWTYIKWTVGLLVLAGVCFLIMFWIRDRDTWWKEL